MSFFDRLANGLGTLLGVLVDTTVQVISGIRRGYEAYKRQGGATGADVVDEITRKKGRLRSVNDEIMHLRNQRMSSGSLSDRARKRWDDLRAEREHQCYAAKYRGGRDRRELNEECDVHTELVDADHDAADDDDGLRQPSDDGALADAESDRRLLEDVPGERPAREGDQLQTGLIRRPSQHEFVVACLVAQTAGDDVVDGIGR